MLLDSIHGLMQQQSGTVGADECGHLLMTDHAARTGIRCPRLLMTAAGAVGATRTTGRALRYFQHVLLDWRPLSRETLGRHQIRHAHM